MTHSVTGHRDDCCCIGCDAVSYSGMTAHRMLSEERAAHAETKELLRATSGGVRVLHDTLAARDADLAVLRGQRDEARAEHHNACDVIGRYTTLLTARDAEVERLAGELAVLRGQRDDARSAREDLRSQRDEAVSQLAARDAELKVAREALEFIARDPFGAAREARKALAKLTKKEET
jgi:hypothetical protein